MRHRIHREIWLVLAITFGMSGLRSLLRLIDATLSPVALNEQSTTLNSSQADSPGSTLHYSCAGRELSSRGDYSPYSSLQSTPPSTAYLDRCFDSRLQRHG